MVVVADKARFGGGEGQEPREAKFCSLQPAVRSLCVCDERLPAIAQATTRRSRTFAARSDDKNTALPGRPRSENGLSG